MREHVEGAKQVLARESGRQRRQPLALIFGRDLGVGHPRRIDGQHQQVADDPRDLATHQAQIVAEVHGATGQLERRRRRLIGHRRHHVEDEIPAHQSEHRRDVFGRDRAAGERDDLIERALRVAHAAFGSARDEQQRLLPDVEVLGLQWCRSDQRLRGSRSS